MFNKKIYIYTLYTCTRSIMSVTSLSNDLKYAYYNIKSIKNFKIVWTIIYESSLVWLLTI